MFLVNRCSININELNINVAQRVYQQALDEVAQLTGLNAQQSKVLFQQLHDAKQVPKTMQVKVPSASPISSNEQQFISALFN